MDPDSALDAFRPKWPYPLGMAAGLVFAIGMFAFTYQLLAERVVQPSSVPLVIVCIGATALGIAWFGILKMDQGGFGPAGGNIFLARDHDAAGATRRKSSIRTPGRDPCTATTAGSGAR